jgi:hypothetical protein
MMAAAHVALRRRCFSFRNSHFGTCSLQFDKKISDDLRPVSAGQSPAAACDRREQRPL